MRAIPVSEGGIVTFTAIVLNDADCVAHALVPMRRGEMADVRAPGRCFAIRLLEDIPRYHKFAILELEAGAAVTKGGEVIGKTSASIPAGAHVHTHNVRSSFREGGYRSSSTRACLSGAC